MGTHNVSGFIQSGARRLEAQQWQERVARAAGALSDLGLAEGGMLALLMRNDLAFIETALAASRLGAYSVPINWHFTAGELRYILEDCAATHLIAHTDLLSRSRDSVPRNVRIVAVRTPPEVEAAYGGTSESTSMPQECDWEELIRRTDPSALRRAAARGSVTYTSGTTGRPKGVKRAPVPPEQQQHYEQLRRDWFGLRPRARTAIVGPLYHSVISTYALAAVRSGVDVFLLPRFEAQELLRLVASERLTHLHLVPTMMIRLLKLPEAVRRSYDCSSLEFVVHGAAPCPPTVKRAMIEWWGPIIHEYYGTSEAGMVTRVTSEEWLRHEGTVGKPWPGRQIRICDAHGATLPPRQEGEIYVGLDLMPDFTYHNASDLRAGIEREGMITNGDIGYTDEDGYLFLCDRKHDLVISGGVNIYPAEVEAVLVTHPLVRDCAVFGIPDGELGEVPAAVVQPIADASPTVEELTKFLLERIARFKVPRLIELRDSLPRQDSGKIYKRLLRDPYWAGSARRI